MKRTFAIAALAVSAGLFAGCQGAASPATSSTGIHTVATVSPSTTTSSPTTTRSHRTAHTLPACGALRDPFDPTGAPPPAGSPAHC